MIIELTLENFLVFKHASIKFSSGLNIITGETGAGKSTILDALEILFGHRAETSFIRTGSDKSTLGLLVQYKNTEIDALLDKHDIESSGELHIRRIVSRNKPSRVYLNGVPVSGGLLAEIASYFVQIIGQFSDRDFLNPSGFRQMLDSLILDKSIKQNVYQAYTTLKDIQQKIASEQDMLQSALREKDYLAYVLKELDALNPQANEEEELTTIRTQLMAIEKNANILQSVEQMLSYSSDGGIEGMLLDAVKQLSAIEHQFPQDLPDIVSQLNQALEYAAQAVDKLSRFNAGLNYDAHLLAETEERLFALRAAARKHHVSIDGLVQLYQEFQEKFSKINFSEANFAKLNADHEQAFQAYQNHAKLLSEARQKIIPTLEQAITKGLHDLNMSHALFRIRLEENPEPTKEGNDKVLFELSTGSGMAFGELHKTASGGELSRFMLSAKSAIIDDYETLVFDEIDRGVGGATAQAVGAKLYKLAQTVGQVIVITHSPQVAAQGDTHFHIDKKSEDQETLSIITHLQGEQRNDEIARMLAGSEITPEAKAAAQQLLLSQT